MRPLGGVLTIPNLVSVARLGLVGWFAVLVADGRIGTAGVVLGVVGATDWIDGFLARRLDQVSEVGKFLDPLADRLAIGLAVVLGLVAGVLPGWFGWTIVVRELAVAVGAAYGWVRGVRRLDVRPLGKAATLLLYFAVTGFYLGVGFAVRGFTVAATVLGLPGVVAYVAVAVAYAGDLRAAVEGR